MAIESFAGISFKPCFDISLYEIIFAVVKMQCHLWIHVIADTCT